MSKDIRSFFTVLSHKPDNSTKLGPKRSQTSAIIDSDEDVVKTTPERHASKKRPTKRRPQVLSSDSDDEQVSKQKQTKSPSKKIKEAKNKDLLKPVNIEDVFKNTPVKQAKVEHGSETPKSESTKKQKKLSAKKFKKDTELGIHNDKDFEQTLIELDGDDDVLLSNLDVLNKTIEEAEKSRINKESPRKRQRRNSSSESKQTPHKKQKLQHVDSGIDPDQERWEKRRHSAALYQKYLNRGGPKHHGSKELPKGKKECLKNLTFLRTGVLDSLESQEFDNLVVEHGGKTVHSVSKKVNFIVVGEEPGPAKLEKARNYNIIEISEDEFLDMILIKSGLQPRYCHKTVVSEDMGIASEDDSPSASELKDAIQLEDVMNASPKKNVCTPELKNKKNGEALHLKNIVRDSKSEDRREPHEMPIDEGKKIKKNDPERNEIISSLKEHQHSTVPSASMSWTEKYKPVNLKGIIGQQDANSNMYKLKKWLEKWYHNQKPEIRKKLPKPTPWNQFDGSYYKCVLLSGPPGVGKTTTATIVCKELGFDIVEFNASDTRNKKLLHEEISQMMGAGSVAGFAGGDKNVHKRRVLLMDEVDGMAGNEDRGGIAELINFIKICNFPIICMCNDRNHQKMRTLVNHCYGLKFAKPTVAQIKGAMSTICFKEGLKIKPDALSELISGTGCDIRQTLNNLFMWSAAEKNLSDEMVHKESEKSHKDVVFGPWDVVRKLFNDRENHDMNLSDKFRLFFYDYSLGPLFVQENYLTARPTCISKNKDKEHLIRVMKTADSLSLGDLVESKIRGTNNWSLLESQALFSTAIPSHYMSGSLERVNFPAWFGKNSKRSKVMRILSELHSHTRTTTSGDKMSIKLDYAVPLYHSIVKPLLTEGVNGISKSLDVMKSYSLLREDLNNLVDLCQGFGNKNIFNDVESRVKSAFTRAYNKQVMLPFAPPVASKKKKNAEDAELMGEDDDELEEDVEEDGVEADTMIKVKVKKEPATSASSSKEAKNKGGKDSGGSKKKGKK
ncbi:replication factor C subunit 1 [Cylas formicarius]|uniref:replication factor C subunit 1 n=1 Tax=Cylas formicarius TaxID=197179 RepID=UPI0029585A11|nr:replication factor C subunit 1 [Cylas formicarius]